jgi:O-antigen/teichoic acid export membrane protein
MPPGAYGTLSLVLGISTLAISLVATPLTQAAIHYYPSVTAGPSGSPSVLFQSLRRCLRRMAPWVGLAALSAGVVYVLWGGGSATLVIFASLLLASDCWRSANLSLLNAARRHRRYVLWTFLDTWARPLVGAAVVFTMGPSPAAVLGAYVAVAAILLAVFSYRLWPEPPDSGARNALPEPRSFDAMLWGYALPLIPLGVIAWASNLGDRYIIAGTLGIADAGVYAAVYGLSSAPFMLVGGTVELALRPVHQSAVANGSHARAQAILRMWLSAVVVVCAIGVVLLAFGHQIVAALCVGQVYRHASGLMPWIGLGYAIRSVSYVFERVCYAYGQTRRVLVTQLCAVAATAAATPAGVIFAGLKGAAMAVPVYFTVQLVTAAILARRTLREAAAAPSAIAVAEAAFSRA